MTPTNPAPTGCVKLNAVADALNKWADTVRDGRQVEPSVTGLRLMATAVRSAAIQPASAQPVVREQDTICDDCGKLLRHDLAHWMEDGASYCPTCRPRPAPVAGDAVSVQEAARVLLEACPNPIFDRLKPALMGEVTEREAYTDEDGNEGYYDGPVSWDAMKRVITAALRALGGEKP
ncbi:RING finger protein [Paracoccus aminophilus]|uniref:Uncharacterized protein n=1 Tax=Paracoccus aminophilus JCM 7686 TaxID=1367847 RepID=S5XRC6_PARAH|nr:hypothetical protein [Paracoccus aminophilus]AGT09959.1 hypothetical protein JCM7686_2903 [Paracoccus aminophilus JCM 7686]